MPTASTSSAVLYWRNAAGDYTIQCSRCDPVKVWKEPSKAAASTGAHGHRRHAHLSLIPVREVHSAKPV